MWNWCLVKREVGICVYLRLSFALSVGCSGGREGGRVKWGW